MAGTAAIGDILTLDVAIQWKSKDGRDLRLIEGSPEALRGLFLEGTVEKKIWIEFLYNFFFGCA